MNSTRNHHHLSRPNGQTIRNGINRDGINRAYIGQGRPNPTSTPPSLPTQESNSPAVPRQNSYPAMAAKSPPESTILYADKDGEFDSDYNVVESPPTKSTALSVRLKGIAKWAITPLLSFFLTIMERINGSKLIDNPMISRVDALLLPLLDWTRISRLLNKLSQRSHSIVAQSHEARQNEVQKGVAPSQLAKQPPNYWSTENQTSPNSVKTPEVKPATAATRLGFVTLALCLVAVGWFWINGSAVTATTAANSSGVEADIQTADGVEVQNSFAVVNPENMPEVGSQEAATQGVSEQLGLGSADGSGPNTSDTALEAGNAVQPLAVVAAAMTPEVTPSIQNNAGSVDGEPAKRERLSNILALANSSSNAAINNPVGEQVKAVVSNAISKSANTLDAASQNANAPKTIGQIALAQRATNTPMPTPTITPTPTEEDIPLDVPQVKLIPILPYPSALPTETATPTPTITPTPLPIKPGSLWSTFVPGPPNESGHFWLGRPFLPSERNQLASTNYQFGSTAYGRYRVHHGLDMSNPIGTPVLATASGEVIHAGIDDPVLLAPFNNFYGNSVVIRLNQRLNIAGSDIDVFVLLGHLTSVTVEVGQQVSPQDVVGTVGMTGIAIGPHLHVEVRVGSNSYDKSVNPYLWMSPRDGTGVVAVRLLTADGRTWPGGRVSLISQGSQRFSRTIEIYLDDEPLGPDPYFGENGAIGSVPPGNYLLAGTVNGERFRKEITVNAGETTFAEIRTQQ